MKKIISIIMLVLVAGLVLSACGSSDDASKSDNGKNDSSSSEKKDSVKDKNEKKKDVYQIGETAKTKTDAGYPYEITVNKFDLTSEDVEGKSLEKDFGYKPEDEGKFAVVNVTIKNIGNKTIVPNKTMTAGLESDAIAERPSDKFFKEGDSELEPGETVTGNMVYTSSHFFKSDVLYFIYEEASTDNEVKFELPVSKN